MLVVINSNASGGNALKKWDEIKFSVCEKLYNPEIIITGDNYQAENAVTNALMRGETKFVSAGGDGTLNMLLNLLLNYVPVSQCRNLTLGAVGIGSSNDFLKPFSLDEFINGIPVKINFDRTEPRDVGLLNFESKPGKGKKFFIINSSIGITAEANYLFNNPDKILKFLKMKNTGAAIVYTAIRKIIAYKNFPAVIGSGNINNKKFYITNLGIIKNPNFSGKMNYGDMFDYGNGIFNLHLSYDMNIAERLKLFAALNKGGTGEINKIKSWQSDNLTVSSDLPFSVEFDGEVLKTRNAVFSLLSKHIKVCT